jgi:(4S)-4-hydroxy-5-phosphonooxypentane-2,3-dione isomerase
MMITIHVFARVKPECVESFLRASLDNARLSILEPGVAQFDLFQQESDSTRFLLIEGYKDESAPARHKEPAHYQAWKDAVAEMMAEPRSSIRYRPLNAAPPRA